MGRFRSNGLPERSVQLVLKPFINAGAFRLAGLTSSLATAALTAIMLGPAGFGRLATLLAVLTAVGTGASLGSGRRIVTILPKQEQGSEDIGMVSRSLASSAAFAAVGGTVVAALSGNGTAGYAAFPILAMSLSTLLILAGAFRATGREIAANLSHGPAGGPATNVATATVFAVMWATDTDLTVGTAFAVYAAAAAVAAAAGLMLAARQRLLLKPEMVTVEELKSSAPYAVNQTISLFPVDLLLASAFLDPVVVGVYAAARRVAGLSSAPLEIANVAAVRRLSKAVDTNMAQAQELVTKIGRLAAVFAVPPLVGFFLFASPLLEILFGTGFGSGAPALRALVVGGMLNVASGPCGNVLTLSNKVWSVVGVTVVGYATLTAAAVAVHQTSGLELASFAAIAAASLSLRWLLLWVTAFRRTGLNTSVFVGSRQVPARPVDASSTSMGRS